jgi:cation:H+ antiporter
MILADLALVVGSLVVLSVAASQFITGAARIATLLGASPLFIGAVLLGAGTSLPDGLVSTFAAVEGEGGLALGNVIGSNTFNISVVLGAGAVIVPVAIAVRTLKREAVISGAAVALFLAFAFIGLGTVTGLILLALVPVAFWLIRGNPPDPSTVTDESRQGLSTGREALRAMLGLLFTVGASRVLVDSAGSLATDAGVSQAIIGLTLVAVGTSLPELAVSIQAARKNELDLMVGNVLGSNLVNSLLIGGVIALISPSTIEIGSLAAAGWLMLGMTAVATWFLATGRTLVRWEGWALIGIYVAATVLVSIA